MAGNTMILLTAAILVCSHFQSYEAANITITPPTGTSSKFASVKCTAETTDNMTRYVVLIKLTNGNKATVMVVKANGGPKVLAPFDKRKDIETQSTIYTDNDVEQSYLELILKQPTPDQSGLYTCTVYYSDQQGAFKDDTASGYLDIPDTRVEELTKQLDALKLKVLKQRYEIDAAKADVSETAKATRIAFTVGKTKTGDLKTGTNLNINAISLNLGKGFNYQDGTFTAPQDGLYVFHLAAKVFQKGSDLDIELRMDDLLVMTDISIGHANTDYDEDSTSTVTRLRSGQKVKAFILKADGLTAHDSSEVTFAGYFIGSI